MQTILFLHSVGEIGGAERMSLVLIKHLPKDKFKCILACPHAGALIDAANELNIETIIAPLHQPSIASPIHSMQQINRWRHLLKTNKIDWLHTADPFCTRSILWASRLANVRVLCHFHFPFTKQVLGWIMRYQPKPTHAVFCSQELQVSTGVALAQIAPAVQQFVVHNGVDIEYFSSSCIPDNRVKRVGIVANLQARKGHVDFLNMAKIIIEKGYKVQFDIIGGDILETPRQPFLENLAVELAIRDCVNFHGQVDNVKMRVGQLDIYVCASHQEAFPVSILEAMALQKTIVSTDVNGIPEAIDDRKQGVLVAKQSPSALADAVMLLLDKPCLADKYALAARQKVESSFSLQAYIDKFCKIYNQ